MEKVDVSVIVIGYNVEKYIEKCLRSLMVQTFQNIEIIVVNDGSSDNTAKMVNTLSLQDGRIRLINQENQGIVAARKCGLENAKADYVAFVDSDDWVQIDYINKLYEVICNNNDSIDMVVAEHINLKGNIEIIVSQPQCQYNHLYKGYEYLEMILEQKAIHNMFGKLYLKSFLISSGYYLMKNVSMGEDLLSQVTYGINQPSVYFIHDAKYYYVFNDDSYSRNNSNKIFELTEVLYEIETLLKNSNMFQKYKDRVDFLWFLLCYFYYCVMFTKRNRAHKLYFYNKWFEKAIYWSQNKYCCEYTNSLDKCNKLLLKLYDLSFNIGYLGNILFRIYYRLKNKN